MLLNYRDFDGFYRSCERTVWAVRVAARAGMLGPRSDGEVPPPEFRHIIEKLIWQDDFQDRFAERTRCSGCMRSGSPPSAARSRPTG